MSLTKRYTEEQLCAAAEMEQTPCVSSLGKELRDVVVLEHDGPVGVGRGGPRGPGACGASDTFEGRGFW